MDTRVALYLRVSTVGQKSGGREQTPENQRLQLEKLCDAYGWTVTKVYEDRISGAKSDRPAFKQMLADAALPVRQRPFNTIMVWSLDRFSREGISKTFAHLEKLEASGIHFYSHTENFLNTAGSAGELRTLLISIFSFVASYERSRTAERIRASLDRKKAKGEPLGRPKKVFNREEAIALFKERPPWSIREVARKYGISVGLAAKLRQVHNVDRNRQ